jgi:hypothetical protein
MYKLKEKHDSSSESEHDTTDNESYSVHMRHRYKNAHKGKK